MSVQYETIPYQLSASALSIPHQDKPELVHDDDPATSVMTDFGIVPPETIPEGANLDTAIHEIQGSNNHLLLVVNDNHHAQGIITSADLLGSKPMQLMQKRGIQREKISVKMLMRPCEVIPVITLDEVAMAKVGNVVQTLHAAKRSHVLAINENMQICGLFSAAQISKQLHRNIVLNQED